MNINIHINVPYRSLYKRKGFLANNPTKLMHCIFSKRFNSETTTLSMHNDILSGIGIDKDIILKLTMRNIHQQLLKYI